ncbi:hypothetical protein GLAREA_11110 [Glarea lozoyensis ATCC 20868]|uniref:Store-operated calcium entry-associated regulatory factor n=1 Tax=Glarea lozoyensis (strain ATCC 20868 / MF5171) TaxID=1116229 RepID=S3DTZ1_GLAL2|nr:uncharacterized protein GLAREA_11110 [Glarea lozoyensis ATCC 20868]EPE35411.1 hypothetical protein GLAREA_11110 [Glarea lozoyensis ATCC 20868]
MHILALLTPLLLLSPAVLSAKPPKNAILLSNVKTLTLRSNAQTSHRRVSAVPQLTCKGPGCRHHKLDILRCTNAGSDYNTEDIQWTCTANMPAEFKLGSTDVQCEGYAHRDDEYVLKGSCAVEYRLLLTELGEEKYGSSWGGGGSGEGWNMGSVLFVVAFLGIAGWILYSLFTAPHGAQPGARRQPGFWGGGWGGGPGGGGPGDDGWDPPPPYPGKRNTYGSSRSNESWRPGFWSGTAAGAAAGYLAGNRGGSQRQQPPANSSSGWGMPTRSTSGSSSSSRHESSGFGSTSRR